MANRADSQGTTRGRNVDTWKRHPRDSHPSMLFADSAQPITHCSEGIGDGGFLESVQ